MADIIDEAPQLRHAADELDAQLKVAVALSISGTPEPFGYVQSIILQSVGADSHRELLTVSPAAGGELVDRLRRRAFARRRAEELDKVSRTLDDDDFVRMRSGDEGRAMARYLLRRLELSANVGAIVEEALTASANRSEFDSRLTNVREKVIAEAESAAGAPLKNRIATFAGEQSSVPAYVGKLLTALLSLKPLYLTENRRPVGKAEAERLLSFKVTRGGTAKLSSIQETVQGLLGVQVDAFESSQTGSGKSAELDVDNFLLEVNGSGIREALRLILDVEFNKPAILLVEEPEIHLHPALETNMLRFLKHVSEECQVFVSTHSTNFLDTAEMKNVYLVSKSDGAATVQRLNPQDAEAKLPAELGIRLSSLFMYDRLVFVEGPSDEAILREWATIVGANLSLANVGFVHMGGVRNFAHYAAEAVVSFLSKRQVRIWFLIDRDERNQREVEMMSERLQGKATLEVLSKRELENYLLVERPLTEFIKQKQRLSGEKLTAPTEDSVVTALEECADEMKDFAIAKRVAKTICLPLYPPINWKPNELKGAVLPIISAGMDSLREKLEERLSKVKVAVEDESKAVEARWSREKLDIVPGDYLLDCVCQRFGVRFKKIVDGARLAANFRADEIDLRLKSVLQDIVR